MRVYEFVCLRKFIKDTIKRAKSNGDSLNYSRLAESMGVQKSYLSQALAGVNNISADQVFLICQYLSLNEKEADYLNLLNEIDRCQIQVRKTQLVEKRDELRRCNTQSDNYLVEHSPANNVSQQILHADINTSLVHMLLTIDKYRLKPVLIERKLRLQPKRLKSIIELLESIGVIEVSSKGKMRVLQDQIHIPRNSPLTPVHGTFCRLKSIEELQSGSDQSNYFFSSTFSANEDAREEIRMMLVKSLKKISHLVSTSPSKEIYQLNFDLFQY